MLLHHGKRHSLVLDGLGDLAGNSLMSPEPMGMGNHDEYDVAEKIRVADYANLFWTVFAMFDDDLLDGDDELVVALGIAIAAYVSSHEVSQFSSKYDAYLAGTAELTEQAQRGLEVFEDEAKGNCAACHPSQPGSDGSPPLFTDFTYDNLGIPRNPNNPFYTLPAERNSEGEAFVDIGLGKTTGRAEDNGKFKVPHLRNIALTAPYFHNGLISTLVEVVAFYNTRDSGSWAPPEVPENVNTDELEDLGLTSQEVTDVVAFLTTLTDGYEP